MAAWLVSAYQPFQDLYDGRAIDTPARGPDYYECMYSQSTVPYLVFWIQCIDREALYEAVVAAGHNFQLHALITVPVSTCIWGVYQC